MNQINARLNSLFTAGTALAGSPENVAALLAYREIALRILEKYATTASAYHGLTAGLFVLLMCYKQKAHNEYLDGCGGRELVQCCRRLA